MSMYHPDAPICNVPAVPPPARGRPPRCAGGSVGYSPRMVTEQAVLAALRGVGLRALSQGDIQVALPVFERCLDLCQTWEIAGWFAIIAAQLGYTYALAGRMRDALPLLEQAMGQGPARRSVYHARLLGYLSEVYLLDGRPEDALPYAVSALELACARKERGFQAYALRLVADIAAQHDNAFHE